MAGIRHPKELRAKVLKMGMDGKTYSQIQAQYPIAKSTLSFWFKNAGRKIDRTRQLEHLKKARVHAVIAIHKKKEGRISSAVEIAQREAATLPSERKDVSKALLAMLYWGEGSKTDTNFKFVNTDPVLARFYISLLRTCYPIDEKRLRIGLHVHYYHKHRDVLRFWSQQLSVPTSQFWRIYDKKRSVRKRFRQNFQGICSIYYPAGVIQRELLALGQALAAKLDT